MKKLAFLLAAVCGLFLLAACGGGGGPRSTAESFTVALAHGDFDTAKKHCTPATAQILDMARSFGGMEKDPKFTFRFVREKIDGDRATVTFLDTDGDEEEITLAKLDGKWLVDIRK